MFILEYDGVEDVPIQAHNRADWMETQGEVDQAERADDETYAHGVLAVASTSVGRASRLCCVQAHGNNHWARSLTVMLTDSHYTHESGAGQQLPGSERDIKGLENFKGPVSLAGKNDGQDCFLGRAPAQVKDKVT